MILSPPIDNPQLPSYHHPALRQVLPALDLCRDVWFGLQGCVEQYLPRYPHEPAAAYNARVAAAVFDNRYRSQVEGIAGLLSAVEVEDAPPTITAAIQDGRGLDGAGADWHVLLLRADQLALRDGFCAILTNAPANTRSAADPVPYPSYQLIERRDLVNWRVSRVDTRDTLTQATVRLRQTVNQSTYGVTEEEFYAVFRLVLGGVELATYSLRADGGRTVAVPLAAPVVAPLPRIPITLYPNNSYPSASDLQPPTLIKTAQLNLKLFRQQSNLDTIQHRVNAPTVYRISAIPIEQRQPVIFGSNHVLELTRDPQSNSQDSVGVLEIAGAGIAALQAAIDDTRAAIETEFVGFLGAESSRSATEVALAASRATSALNGLARAKQAAIVRLVGDWCLYTRETAEVHTAVDHSLLELPLDAQEIGQLLALWQAGAIDHQTLLELLKMGRQLPPGADVSDLLARAEAERTQSLPTVDLEGLI